jgi:hypothetical protein
MTKRVLKNASMKTTAIKLLFTNSTDFSVFLYVHYGEQQRKKERHMKRREINVRKTEERRRQSEK